MSPVHTRTLSILRCLFRCQLPKARRRSTPWKTTPPASRAWSWPARGTGGPWRRGPCTHTLTSWTTEQTSNTRYVRTTTFGTESLLFVHLFARLLQVNHLVDVVVRRTGLELGDQFKANSRKVKFVVKGPLPLDKEFVNKFTDFEVVHHYLRVRPKSSLE